MPDTSTMRQTRTLVEPKNLFRADVDQSGDWYVWRKLGSNGWATLRRCSDREHAQQLARDLNRNPAMAV